MDKEEINSENSSSGKRTRKNHRKRELYESHIKQEIAGMLQKERDLENSERNMKTRMKEISRNNKELRRNNERTEDELRTLKDEMASLMAEIQGPLHKKLMQERNRTQKLEDALAGATHVFETSAQQRSRELDQLKMELSFSERALHSIDWENKELVETCGKLEHNINDLKQTLGKRQENESILFKNLNRLVTEKHHEAEELKKLAGSPSGTPTLSSRAAEEVLNTNKQKRLAEELNRDVSVEMMNVTMDNNSVN